MGHSLDILVPEKEAGPWQCDAGNNCPQVSKSSSSIHGSQASYNGYNNGQGGAWRCDKDKRWRRGGTCDFDVCVTCMAKYQVGVGWLLALMLSQKLREEKMVENSTIRMMLALGEEEKVNSKAISERKKG